MKTNNKRDGFDLCLERYLGISNGAHEELSLLAGSRIVFGSDGFMRVYVPEKKAWTCEGLPPVGAVCEHRTGPGMNWSSATVLAYGEKKVFYRDRDGHEWSRPNDEIEFRPIRTPEQIADDERAKAAIGMSIDIGGIESKRDQEILNALALAGYRKHGSPTCSRKAPCICTDESAAKCLYRGDHLSRGVKP